MPELYRTKEVAKMFSVSLQTIDRWRLAGELKCVRVGNSHPRFTRQAIDEFIAANEIARETA